MADGYHGDLERQFHQACAEAVLECKRLNYNPTAWITMSERYGAAEAARRLITSGTIQSGFEQLVIMGRPDLTIESAVLDPRWGELFSPQVRAAARWRLDQVSG